MEGLKPPTVALGVLVVNITSCSASPGVGVGEIETTKVGRCVSMHMHVCVHVTEWVNTLDI